MRIRGQLRRVLGAGVMCSHSQRPARSCLPMAPLTKVFSRQMARIRCPLSKRWAKNSFLMCPLWSGVDVGLGTANSGSGNDTLTVNIRKGDITSAVLATKSQLVTDGFDGLLHFDFPSSLAVTPGDLYVLEVKATVATFAWKSNSGGYADGRGIISGSPSAGLDFQFQTFTHAAVPVPGMSGPTLGALAALLVGAFVVVSLRRRRATAP